MGKRTGPDERYEWEMEPGDPETNAHFASVAADLAEAALRLQGQTGAPTRVIAYAAAELAAIAASKMPKPDRYRLLADLGAFLVARSLITYGDDEGEEQ